MQAEQIEKIVPIRSEDEAVKVIEAIGKYDTTELIGSLEEGDYAVKFVVTRLRNVIGWILVFNPKTKKVYTLFEIENKAPVLESAHQAEVFAKKEDALQYIKDNGLDYTPPEF